MDTILEKGVYNCLNGTITETLLNKPKGLMGGFRLENVETTGGGWFFQTITDHRDPIAVYCRAHMGNKFGTWKKMATDDQISQINSDLANLIKYAKWLPQNGYDPLTESNIISIYSVNPRIKPAQGLPSDHGYSEYGTIILFRGVEYHVYMYIDLYGNVSFYSNHLHTWMNYTKKWVISDNNDHGFKVGYDSGGIYIVVDNTMKKYLQYKS